MTALQGCVPVTMTLTTVLQFPVTDTDDTRSLTDTDHSPIRLCSGHRPSQTTVLQGCVSCHSHCTSSVAKVVKGRSMNWLMARHSIRRPESDLDMLRVTMPTVSTNFSSGRGWLDNGRNTNTQIQNKVNKAVTDVFYNMTDCFIMENRTDLGKCMYSPVRTHTHTHTLSHSCVSLSLSVCLSVSVSCISGQWD